MLRAWDRVKLYVCTERFPNRSSVGGIRNVDIRITTPKLDLCGDMREPGWR